MRKIQVEWEECGHGGAWRNLQSIALDIQRLSEYDNHMNECILYGLRH